MESTFKLRVYKLDGYRNIIKSTCKDYIYNPSTGTTYFILFNPKEDEEENFILYFDKFRPCRSSKLSVLIKNTEVNLIKTKGKFKTELFPDIVFSDGENSKKIENNYKKDFISYLLNIVCSDVFADKDLIGF